MFRKLTLLSLIFGIIIAIEGKGGIEWDEETTQIVSEKVRELLKNPPTEEFDLRGEYFYLVKTTFSI